MAEDIEVLFAELLDRPRTEIVQQLAKKGDVNSLTQFKMKLAEKGRQYESFPKGQVYSRRKPKGCSNYSTLEERLANDICVLSDFLDSGNVSSELQAMFKCDSNFDISVVTVPEADPQLSSCTAEESNNMTPFRERLLRGSCVSPSGVSDVKSQIASIQSAFLMFREQAKLEISDLQKKLKGLSVIIESQAEQIAGLYGDMGFRSKLWELSA